MATITGIAGTSVNAVCTVSDNGVPIAAGESSATAQSIENDLATIKGGTYTTTAVVTDNGSRTCSGDWIMGTGSTFGAFGTTRKRVAFVLADRAGVAYLASPTVSNVFQVKTQSASVKINLTLATIPPTSGDWMRFVCPVTANDIHWAQEGGADIVVLNAGGGGGGGINLGCSLEFLYNVGTGLWSLTDCAIIQSPAALTIATPF